MKYTYQLSTTDNAISIWDTNGEAIQVYRKNQTTWIALVNDKNRPGCKVEKMFRITNNKPRWLESGDNFAMQFVVETKRCPIVALQHESISNFISATKAELNQYRKTGLSSLFVNDSLVPDIDLVLFLYWDRWSRSKLVKISRLQQLLRNPSIDVIFLLTQVAMHNYYLTGNATSKYKDDGEIVRKGTINNAVYFKLRDMVVTSKSLKEFKALDSDELIFEIKTMLDICYDIWNKKGIVYADDLKRAFDGDWAPSNKALHGFIQIAINQYFRHALKVK